MYLEYYIDSSVTVSDRFVMVISAFRYALLGAPAGDRESGQKNKIYYVRREEKCNVKDVMPNFRRTR